MTQQHLPRYAVYFTADPGSPLARFGASIIGYDADTGRDVPHLALSAAPPAELASVTQAPRRYGFHATLVAPFQLNSDNSEDQLCRTIEEFGEVTEAALLGQLEVSTLSGFIALTPRETSVVVDRLAARCVEFFDRYRAPLSAHDLARRSAGDLSARQRQNLERWGYPYVFDDFRFHMTLTERLAPNDRPRFHEALSEAFRPIADLSHRIEAMSLMRQRDPDSRFEVIARGKLSQGF
jgi:putative phosphonate metabolism protein